jgi:hypothetical protein
LWSCCGSWYLATDSSARRAGALDSEDPHRADRWQDRQRGGVASQRGRELTITQLMADGIDGRNVAGVGVDISTSNHTTIIVSADL